MLERLDAKQCKASCKRCMRSSPVLAGDDKQARSALIEMGWAQRNDSEWSCPVCESRTSGDWTKREE